VKYKIRFKPKAIKTLKKLQPADNQRILAKIEVLTDNLQGDVKKLTNFTPEYRLRVGNYRILFEIEEDVILIYSIKHRQNAYQ
jgi:mRNA interferase RelE/StbE